jgi:hypothetical protein
MLKLGGLDYQVISSSTIEWDVTLLNLLQGCGLADVTLHHGETAEGLALRVYRTLMSSGAVFEILACVLVPATVDPLEWTPELMAKNAALFKRLHTEADKSAIKSQITTLVSNFFAQGLLSVRTFPSYSTLLQESATAAEQLKSGENSSQPPTVN